MTEHPDATTAAPVHTNQDDTDVEPEPHDPQLAESAALIALLERGRALDAALVRAGTIDLEAARLLGEVALDEMDEPDVDGVVEVMARERPWLFRAAAPTRHGVQGARVPAPPPEAALAEAGTKACASGRRQDVLAYLRLRRKG